LEAKKYSKGSLNFLLNNNLTPKKDLKDSQSMSKTPTKSLPNSSKNKSKTDKNGKKWLNKNKNKCSKIPVSA
jgi:hypothetical protein